MPISNSTHAIVKRALLKHKNLPAALAALDTLCAAGAQCQAVQGSPICKQQLANLQGAVTAAHKSMNDRMALAQALLAAIQTLKTDFGTVKVTLDSYETEVNVVADGDPAIINQAGCQARGQKAPPASLGLVTLVQSKPGKQPTEALLTWPVVMGATTYAIELNFTPQNPAGPWTPINPGSRRRRVVKGPAPASQFLARVAALSGDGTRSEWSSAVLVTTL